PQVIINQHLNNLIEQPTPIYSACLPASNVPTFWLMRWIWFHPWNRVNLIFIELLDLPINGN
ncbi:MAG: hypothetical protein ABIJ65_09890, partial [Chloroflexota bacterium]